MLTEQTDYDKMNISAIHIAELTERRVQTMEKMEVGLMLGVGDDPRESIAKLQQVGVNNAQMGVPPDDYLVGDAYL